MGVAGGVLAGEYDVVHTHSHLSYYNHWLFSKGACIQGKKEMNTYECTNTNEWVLDRIYRMSNVE